MDRPTQVGDFQIVYRFSIPGLKMLSETRLLLVNHNNEERSLLKNTLTDSGLSNIVEAHNGNIAVELLNHHIFDIIITDIEIDQLDAWRLTRLVRSGALLTTADTPVVIVSNTFSERIAEATTKEFEANFFLSLDQYQKLPELLLENFVQRKTPPRKTRILVIEDYDETIAIVRRVLHGRFEIDSANNGVEGLAAWKKHRHDIVLLDLVLPEMCGEKVLEEIVRINPNQSVIMMTAYSSAQKAGALILKGAVDFLSKPFRADQLRHVCNIAAHREDYIVSNQQFVERQKQLTEEKERAQVTLESIGEGVITTDALGYIDYLNPIAEKLTGWSTQEAHNKPLSDIFQTFHECSKVPAANPLEKCLRESRFVEGSSNILLRNRFAHELIIEHSAAPIKDRYQKVAGAVMVFRDSTEARQMQRQLTYHASHDTLTGLSNREVFEKSLRSAIEDAIEDTSDIEKNHALCHLNLNKFKLINDSCGHAAGDKLLKALAELIANQVRGASDTIARLGGDEFGILLRQCPEDAAIRIAENICEAIQNYLFTWENNIYQVGVSIGIASINKQSRDLLDAFSSAETACHVARERGGSCVHVYRADDAELVQRRDEMRIITQLVTAEKENRFELYCQEIQPIQEITKTGYEILIRMRDEDNQIVAPGQFLGAAERYNMMRQIDRWVLRNSIHTFANHPMLFDDISHFSINLSALSLTDDSCYDFIAAQFDETGISPELICFEITETAAIGNFVRAGGFISAIRDLGCKFALDDFGSGMSSFAYLKKLPVDYLKIDGMFVKGVLEDPIDYEMVRSINEIGQVLNLQTIAEFVENPEILHVIREIGVDFAQGYEIAKPKPLSSLIQQVSSHSGTALNGAP